MVELIQFRAADNGDKLVKCHPRTAFQYRQAQVVSGPGGQLLVLTDEQGRVQYGDWQEVPSA